MQQFSYYADLSGIQLAEVGGKTVSWLKVMPVGKYKHPFYGEIDLNDTRVKRFAENVKKRVRGIDPDIDYDHKTDASKGNQAAGWVKDAEARTDGLYAFVEWTPTAVAEIKEGKWRYISPDFQDEWTDPQGTKFSDVLNGAGLTNRPFLKDLAPINLSELSFKFDDQKTDPKKEGTEVDPKQLRERLGLPEGATDAEVDARCALLKQLSEAFPQGAPKAEPPKPTETPKVQLQLSDAIKQLAEDNPTAKALISHLEDQIQMNADMAKQLREENVARKLHEFDNSKITLTPIARDLVTKIMLNDSMSEELAAQVWDLLDKMKTGSSFYVELGERAGVTWKYGARGDKSPGEQIQKLTEAKVAGGMKYADAVEAVAKENPQLYNEYRSDSYAFQA